MCCFLRILCCLQSADGNVAQLSGCGKILPQVKESEQSTSATTRWEARPAWHLRPGQRLLGRPAPRHPAEQDAKSEHTRKRQTNLALSSSSSPSPCSEGSSACAVRELTHTPRASLAVPPEELGEETLEEDEVDVEDLATGAGPGVPGAQHSSLRGAEGSARHSCHAKAAL